MPGYIPIHELPDDSLSELFDSDEPDRTHGLTHRPVRTVTKVIPIDVGGYTRYERHHVVTNRPIQVTPLATSDASDSDNNTGDN